MCEGEYALMQANYLIINYKSIFMFRILFLLFLGIGVGYLLRNIRFVHKLGSVTQYVVFLLLFVFGVSVGRNQMLMDNITKFGLQAAIIALSGVIGSFAAAYFWGYWQKRKEGGKR